jgi:hypothetical protein
MEKAFEIGLALTKKYWRRRATGVLLPLAIFAFLIRTLWPEDSAFGSISWLTWLTAGAVAAAAAGVWIYTNRTPRNRRGHIGFLVAIACESDVQERKLRADFIDELRRYLSVDEQATKFHLIVYPRGLSEEIVSIKQALRYQAKSRAHFMIWGRVRERSMPGGKKALFLDLEGSVVHGPISRPAQQDIQSEFNTVLPRRVVVPDEGSVFHFEAASEWMDVAARYIVGRAALAAGDIRYAETLLLSVEERLNKAESRNKALRQVRQKLPGILVALYLAWATHLGDEYTRTRDSKYLRELEPITDKLLARDSNNYNGLLLKAIVVFVVGRNSDAAKRLVRKAGKSKDATWRYSLAFLYAYEGDLARAVEEYHRAFRAKSLDQTIAVQSEEFIQGVLEGEPEKGQLHYMVYSRRGLGVTWCLLTAIEN